ncbi:MAG: aminotransferase class III-fold pyridoxal phosphate-dependent enzyme, partial [Mycetocola sp.]
PLAMASIVGALDAMADEGIVENAARIGREAIGPGLAELAEKHSLIGEVRGEGVFWAMELVADRATREPLPASAMGQIKAALVGRGLLPFVQDNRIHVVPPCTVTSDEVAEALAAYDAVFTTVQGGHA